MRYISLTLTHNKPSIGRKLKYTILLFLIVTSLLYYTFSFLNSTYIKYNEISQFVNFQESQLSKIKYFNDILLTINNYKPISKPIAEENYNESFKIKTINYMDLPKEGPLNIEFLSKYLKLSDDQIRDLKKSHKNMFNAIDSMEYPHSIYQENSNGIVIIGGGKFMVNALTSIKLLRDIGSTLPIELFIVNEQEYDSHICDVLLPKLNAKCLSMTKFVSLEILNKFKFQKYQFKSLGLWLSSFQNVLLLDADNYVIENPDSFFDSKVFKDKGLIFWPDFWRRVTSPYFYQVADVNLGLPIRKDGIEPEESLLVYDLLQDSTNINDNNDSINDDDLNKFPLADLKNAIPDSSTEAGQILINKKKHYKSLLLSLYYNIYGYDYYYDLLSQRTWGQGDKETFITAAQVFNEDFYQVQNRLVKIGYKIPNGGFTDTTMIQFNPIEDFNYYTKIRNFLDDTLHIDPKINLHLRNNNFLSNLWENHINKFLNRENANINSIDGEDKTEKPKPFAIHLHQPKINPIENYMNGDYFSQDGNRRRQLGWRKAKTSASPLQEEYNDFTYSNHILEKDYELYLFRVSQWITCDLKFFPKTLNLNNAVELEVVCKSLQEHIEWLIETSDTPELQYISVV